MPPSGVVPAPPARRLGPWRIVSELGRGANGVVYRAVDERLRREVALKTLTGVADEATMERFVREARAGARLRHPGIVAVYGAEVVQGVRVIALELVLGGSLKQRLADGPLAAREAAKLVHDLALAVQAAHDEGIVHRDLKPANVLLERDGRPRLTDFGLARDEQAPRLTTGTAVVGTPSYMAPEQTRGASVGPLADVWGLGAVLYHCLAGQPPFTGERALDVMRLVATAEPPAPSRVRAGRADRVHADLDTIALRCLEKDPARRYASAGDLAADLRRFLDGEPIVARPASRLERARRRLARHGVAALLGAVALLATGALAVVLVRAELARRETRTALRRIEERIADARDRDSSVEAAVQELARDASDLTVKALSDQLDALSAELRDETVKAIGRAADRGDRIEGLAAAAERFASLSGEERLPPADARAINEAERRLLAAGEGKTPPRSLREVLARAQEARLGVPRLRFARILCESLGKIGRVEGAAALARHLDAEQDELRALHAATALLRLPSVDAVRKALHAQDRFGRSGRFAERLGRGVDLKRVDAFFAPQTAREFRDRGEIREGANRHEEALADFTKAIELDPKDPGAFQSRALVHAHFGRKEMALADFARAIELDPAASRFVRRAAARAAWNDLDGALADATHAVTIAPREAEGWSTRGWTKVLRKDHEGALADCARAAELDPRFARAYLGAGVALREKGDLGRALEVGLRATELDPGSAEAWTNLGQTHDRRKEHDAALECMTRAIDLEPAAAEMWAARGVMRVGVRDYERGLEDLNRALELKPSYVRVWVNRASVRGPLGDWEGAIADCTRALELDPKVTEAWVNRAVAKHSTGDTAGALQDLDHALELAPEEGAIYRTRGMLRLAKNDGAGLQDLTRAIELGPRAAENWVARGQILEKLRRYPEAISDFTRALELEPSNGSARMGLCTAKLQSGDLKGAVAEATTALASSPTSADAFFLRGMARTGLGEKADAATDLARALEIAPDASWAPQAKRALEQVR